MTRNLTVVACLLFLTAHLSAQTYTTTTYKIRFTAYNEGMWNSGPTGILPAMEKNYSFSWDKSKKIGGMESVLGMDFGAELYGKTAGTIGLGYYMSNINGGMIDSIVYPINIEFSIPRPEDIRAGQTIKIPSRAWVNAGERPTIETTFPAEGKVGVKMGMKLETDLRMSVCAFDECLVLDPKKIHGCVERIMDFDLYEELGDKPLLEISTLNSTPGAIVPELVDMPCVPNLKFSIPCLKSDDLIKDFNYWPSTTNINFFPIEFGLNRTLKSKHPLSKYAKCIEESLADTTKSAEDCISVGNLSSTIRGRQKLEDFLVGYFSIPFIDTLYTSLSGNNLRSVGSDTALSMEFNPLKLMAGGKFHDGSFSFPIPCSGSYFHADYMLIKPTVNLDVIAKQDLNFDAKVVVSLELPTELTYRVVNKRGVTVKSGLDDVITYQVGNDLYIDFPCNYEYMDFKPTFRVQNEFTNRTYASFNMDGRLQAMSMGIRMDEITVVPKIKLCVPNPFGDDWCTTIPKVSFGFDASVGPLVNESISNFMANPDDLNIELDIFNDTWEIKSFLDRPATSFRVAPSPFIATVEPDTLDCNGQRSGELEAMIQAGTPPYNYEWSNKAYGKVAAELPAGDYFVKVTDRNGCVAMNGASVFEYPELAIDTTMVTHPECYGDLTGSIVCEIRGGNPPYSYAWSNGVTSPGISGLGAGDYNLTVTDRNGCSVTRLFTIQHPPELTAYVNHKVDADCFGANTGSIRVNVNGGIPGYDFFWSNGAIAQDIDSLKAGTYSLEVVDRNNCRVALSSTILEPPELIAFIEVPNPISCYQGDDGVLSANISGGVAPYDLTWYDRQHTLNHKGQLLEGLEEGLFQLDVVDNNGCFRQDTLFLRAPAEPFRTVLTETHLSCNGSEDGMFSLSVSGGTSPFRYKWSDGSTEKNRSDLPAGKYHVTIIDANECVTHNNMVLLEPFELTGTFTMKKVTCEGEEDGALEFSPGGGTPPYYFYWDNGSTGQRATGFGQGMHSVTINDAMGCESTFVHELVVDGTDCFDIPNAFSPNGDMYNDTWVIKNIDTMYPDHHVRIFTAQGRQIYDSGRGGYVPWEGKRNNREVPAGTYYYIIDFGNGDPPDKGALTIVR